MASAKLGSCEISHITRVRFSGSSTPIQKILPRCKGVILRPSNDAERTISLGCSYHIAGKTKAQIEGYHHDLNEELAARANQDLSVSGNIYTNVVPMGTTFDNKADKEHFVYALNFALDHKQNFFTSQIDASSQARKATFIYEYGDKDQYLSTFEFFILHMWESVIDVQYNLKNQTRRLREFGRDKEINSGVESIRLHCAVIKEPILNLENYFFNYICGIGPLGKQGTLYLAGNSYEKAIMTSFSQGETKVDAAYNSCEYDIEFQVSIQC